MMPLVDKLVEVDEFFNSISVQHVRWCKVCQKLFHDVSDIDTSTITDHTLTYYNKAYDAIIKQGTEHFEKEHKK